jgi:outer membrane protein assembly factor BamB
MDNNVILLQSRVPASGTTGAHVVEAGYSAADGHQIWLQTRTGDEALNGQSAYFSYVVGDNGVYAYFKQETMTWYGYDINTGNKLWQTTPYDINGWGEYYTTIGDGPAYCAYGNLYATSYDGVLHCYDMKTGTHKWDTAPTPTGIETPYGNYPYFGPFVIADGKIYVGNGEHQPITPMFRGYSLHCFDAYTGQPVFDILGYFNNIEIADGYLVSVANQYDMQIYSFGKGQTATTVSASPGAVPAGTEITLSGTVYDKSPSAPDNTPAVSKDSMTEFMEYLYMQQPQPTNTVGVPVSLVAIDSSGKSTTIGTVTTDSTGFYALNWKVPSSSGVYRIVANFATDESYFGSSAITALTVQSAGATAGSLSVSDMYIALIVAVIVVVIALVVAVLILRRK